MCARGLTLAALGPAMGCSGTDVGYPRYILVEGSQQEPVAGTLGVSGDGTPSGNGGAPGAGSGGTRSGAAGRSSSTGASGSGGAESGADTGGNPSVAGGAGGVPLGNAGSAAGGDGAGQATGGVTTERFTWPGVFDPAGAPTPATGQHNPGSSCMLSSCHGTKVPFVFGGTVYQADGTTAAQHVEVGVADAALTLTAYTASNGNIWLPSSAGAIDWANAVISVRSVTGEVVKPASSPRGSSCNGSGCHNTAMRLKEP